ncbi:hypothetical protein ACF1BE_10665 [Streptomyces sp. NPDC014991]|uniref:hypothetical protein n=1 Tax=Streptomyces sp. NPDC014991 TaxID=3364935 RepID=UPI0036FC9CB5
MYTMRHEGKDASTYVGTLDWVVTTALFAVPLCLDYAFGSRSWAAFISWPLWALAALLLLMHWSTAIRSLRGRKVELWGWWAAALAHVIAVWHIIAVIKDVQ